MGRLFLISLAVLLSVASSSPLVDKKDLSKLVSEILNRYRPIYQTTIGRRTPMFSLAVRIPFNSQTNKFDISQVDDNPEVVKREIIACDVYTGRRVVAATLLKWPDVSEQCPNSRVVPGFLPKWVTNVTWTNVLQKYPKLNLSGRADHAEYRVMQKLSTLNQIADGNDLLLIYVYASPCATKCTNISHPANILNLLQPYRNSKVVFVFSKVFKPRNKDTLPAEQPQDALINLGNTIGLDHIFRCDGPRIDCVSCYPKGKVDSRCYSDN